MGAFAKWGFAGAAQAMLLLSALYEPARVLLQSLGWREVGGVGGVGGLANLGDPSLCSTASGRAGAYCYLDGIVVVAGFSSMALVVLLLWSLPLLLGAAATAVSRPTAGTIPAAATSVCESVATGEVQHHKWFHRAWLALSCLWFLLPLSYFLSDPFFRKSVHSVVLAVSLAASYALSWHLALVAVPVSELVAPHLGLPDSTVKGLHKAVGWRTLGWAAVHGFGQLFYLAFHGFAELNVAKSGENLLYVLGVVTVVLMALHAAFALARKQLWLRARFQAVHRLMAALVLLSATAHWWPFAIFLVPSTAAHGGMMAARRARAAGHQVSVRHEALALAAACIGALIGLAAAWAARDSAMRQPAVDMLSPFAFPPLALLAQGLGAWAAATLSLWAAPASTASLTTEELGSPLASVEG